jgi:uncharacterized protein YkwD
MKKTGGIQPGPPRNRRLRGVESILGVLVGAVVFGGTAAAAAGIIAQPKTAAVVIDGQTVDLKGFIIEGAHYFQLRDLDEKLIPGGKDFSIVWDGAGNRVIIDTTRGYDPAEQHTAPATVTPQPEQAPAMTIDEMREEVIALTNAERVKVGLPELAVLPELMDCAQAKAQDLIDNNYYDHTSPRYGTFRDMLKAFVPKAKSGAENLARKTKIPAEAFAAWVESPAHFAIITSPKYTHIGVGAAEGANGVVRWVQQFVSM